MFVYMSYEARQNEKKRGSFGELFVTTECVSV